MSVPGSPGAIGRTCPWQNLRVLELLIRSPWVKGRLTDGQKSMAGMVLVDYLRSFMQTLEVLKFGWIDGDGGPNPLLMGGTDRSKSWVALEELWLGGVTVTSGDVAALKFRAPLLEKIMVLEETRIPKDEARGHTSGDMCVRRVWEKVFQTAGMSLADSSVSTSSRLVPIRLDL